MKTMTMKITVILLTALALTLTAFSAVAVMFLSNLGLYNNDPEALMHSRMTDRCNRFAEYVTLDYNLRKLVGPLDGFDYYQVFPESSQKSYLNKGLMGYSLCDTEGNVLEQCADSDADYQWFATFYIDSHYPLLAEVDSERELKLMYDSQAEDTQRIWEDQLGRQYRIFRYQGPRYQVEVQVEQAYLNSYYADGYWELALALYPYRILLATTLALGMLSSLVGLGYLGWAAGKSKKDAALRLVGLCRMPLDLYALLTLGLIGAICAYVLVLVDNMIYGSGFNGPLVGLGCAGGLICALLGVLLFYAFAAQVKIGGGLWWRRSLLGRGILWLWKGIKWCLKLLLKLVGLLPVVWQYLLVAAGMLLVLLVGMLFLIFRGDWLIFLWAVLLCLGVVLYGAYAFATLRKGAHAMARGNLDQKISTGMLLGEYRGFAGDLNALGEVVNQAAREQLRSERMKTELITNVSHDIKTPLTSIINFVDLLRQPHTPEQEQEYLAVLDRQSRRMKKLLEDLLELSKANTGNIQAQVEFLDGVETVTQALGEFSDKLEAAGLTPVFRQPGEKTMILADGRLTWRVLSNLLQNAVKYALPGTRLYIDLVKREGKVLLSLKNVSREALNMDARELMERFVRGDVSRNTEGSGLGLNIAQSLMAAQGGSLGLTVDGDLFKVTLVFPTM